jgi:hypothetical protein
MKITKLLIAICLIVPFLSACLDDVSEIDTRAAIAKKWRVTDNYDNVGSLGYDVTINVDATESTRVIFTNFGGWDTSDKLYATLANKTLTIPSQTLDGFRTISGTATIANDLNSISFTYHVSDTDGNNKDVTAEYGQNFAKKKAVKIVQ